MILSKIIKKIGIAVAIILALIVFLPCIYSVYPSQYVLVKQFGRVERVVSESGVNFKLPFIQSIDRLPKSTNLYDMKALKKIPSELKDGVREELKNMRRDPTVQRELQMLNALDMGYMYRYYGKSSKDYVDVIFTSDELRKYISK